MSSSREKRVREATIKDSKTTEEEKVKKKNYILEKIGMQVTQSYDTYEGKCFKSTL